RPAPRAGGPESREPTAGSCVFIDVLPFAAVTTKFFVDWIRNLSYAPPVPGRVDERTETSPPTDRRRAGHPERAVGARTEHRARRARGAEPHPGHRLHHRSQAVTDHDRKRARGAR